MELLDVWTMDVALQKVISEILKNCERTYETDDSLSLLPTFASNDENSFDKQEDSMAFDIPDFMKDNFVIEIVLENIVQQSLEEGSYAGEESVSNQEFCEKKCVKKFCFNLTVEKLRYDDDAIHFFTGLETYDKFLFVFRTLGTTVDELCYIYNIRPKNISPVNQFFFH